MEAQNVPLAGDDPSSPPFKVIGPATIPQPPLSVKICAYIFFVLAALLACFAMLVLLAQLLMDESPPNPAMADFSGLAVAPLWLQVFLYCSVGYGLLKLKGWARTVALLVATLSLCLFPAGTILGGAALYLMYRSESVQAFRQGEYLL